MNKILILFLTYYLLNNKVPIKSKQSIKPKIYGTKSIDCSNINIDKSNIKITSYLKKEKAKIKI